MSPDRQNRRLGSQSLLIPILFLAATSITRWFRHWSALLSTWVWFAFAPIFEGLERVRAAMRRVWVSKTTSGRHGNGPRPVMGRRLGGVAGWAGFLSVQQLQVSLPSNGPTSERRSA